MVHGNFIVESSKKAKIYAFGEEPDIHCYNICITNLWLHDIYDKRIKEDLNEQFQLMDIAIANPPFKGDIGYKMPVSDMYGVSQSMSSYIKYIDIMLNSITSTGKMAIVLPQGFLFKKTNIESFMRKRLIEENFIDAIIALPEKLFFNTKIPVIILIINKARKNKGILFIDASNEYKKERNINILTEKNQEKIIETYKNYITIENYSYVAKSKEIIDNDFNLNIKNYVHQINKKDYIDIKKLNEDIDRLEQQKLEIQEKIKRLIAK